LPVYEIVAIGGTLSAFVLGCLLVVREANHRASDIEIRMEKLVNQETNLIDKETMEIARGLIARHRAKTEELTSEDRQKLFFPSVADMNLRILQSRISEIRDTTTRAYILGVGCASLSLLTTLAFSYSEVNSPLWIFASFGAVASLILALWYFKDGILVFLTIRKAEMLISSLRSVTSVKRLYEEVLAYLKAVGSPYLIAEE
jgi:hypothetical protein